MATKIGNNSNNTIDGTSGADTLWGRGGNDTLNGLGGADKLYGEAGNDVLKGGLGNDLLDGGTGIDRVTYYNDGGTRGLSIDLGTGIAVRGYMYESATEDRLVSIEDVYGSGSGDTIVGDDRANRLEGGGGDDALFGGGGSNVIDGGAGQDSVGFTYDWDEGSWAGERVVADLVAGTYAVGAQTSRIANIENAYGSEVADSLSGNGLPNTLFGGDGDDELRGFGGADRLYGDDGVDTIYGGDGDDFIMSGGFHDSDFVYGESGNDQLFLSSNGHAWGGPGADYFGFDGITSPPPGIEFTIHDFDTSVGDVIDLSSFTYWPEQGREVALGFIGQDAFTPTSGPQVRYENNPDGSTTIQFTEMSNSIDENGEYGPALIREIHLDGTKNLSADDFLLGFSVTEGSDTIAGTKYSDAIYGRGGNDVIKGLAGDDYLDGGPGNDDVNGGDGNDDIADLDGDNTLYGGPGNDQIYASVGRDQIGPGYGVDWMWGGRNNDTFDINNGDSGVGPGARDVIQDFAKGDIIDLRSVDAKVGTSGDQAFTFVGGQAFSAAGQLRYYAVDGSTIIQGSTDSDNGPELEIQLTGFVTPAASDFYL